MITPADSPSSPENYNAIPVSMTNIQAPQDDLTSAVAEAGRLAGAGIIYPQGPRQAQTETLLSSPQGFATEGYDIDAGYASGWPNDVEPTVAGP